MDRVLPKGCGSKTVLTEIGTVQIEVSRDVETTFNTDDCKEAAAPADWAGSDRAGAVGARIDHRGDLSIFRRGV
jgi:hypothetical protein